MKLIVKAGDRVRKRGFPFEGTVIKSDETWVTIEWDDGMLPKVRPKMCHVAELAPAAS